MPSYVFWKINRHRTSSIEDWRFYSLMKMSRQGSLDHQIQQGSSCTKLGWEYSFTNRILAAAAVLGILEEMSGCLYFEAEGREPSP